MIDIQVLLSFISKEFKQIFRTREMLMLMFGAPLMQLLVLGFAVTNEVKQVKLFIEDRDNTQSSRQLSNSFGNTDRFVIVRGDTSVNPLVMIHEWKTQIAIVIPRGFGEELRLGRKPDIQILADGMDGNSAAVAISYASAIVSQFITEEASKLKRFAADNPMLSKSPAIVKVEDRMWYNPDLNSSQYMIPGIIVILITVVSMMMSSMSLVKEKEIGTMEQLMVSPVRKSELLLGKLIPYWLITMFEISIVSVAAHFIFGIHFAGSPLVMGLFTAVYLITTLGLGIFISTLTDTQQQAMFFSWFVMVFMILLSGLFVPIQNMPPLIRKITLLNPMRHFLSLTRDVMIKGAGLKYLYREALALFVYGISIISFCIIKFHKTAS